MIAAQTTQRDSRFFPGYLWVSEDPDGQTGLSIKAPNEEAAARRFLASKLQWINRGRSFTCWVMADAESEPKRVELTVRFVGAAGMACWGQL